MAKAQESSQPLIPGYDFGTAMSARSPVSMEDLGHLEQTLGWTAEDQELLGKHADLFRSLADAMVESWRAVIRKQPHLSQWFVGADGEPDDEYNAAVKKRFVQWVVDVATRPHDQAWLDYQEEIGLRHTPAKRIRQTIGTLHPWFRCVTCLPLFRLSQRSGDFCGPTFPPRRS
jgi:hypothetical protein